MARRVVHWRRLMAPFTVFKIKSGTVCWGTQEAKVWPWLVFQGSQRERAIAFSSWDKAFSYAIKQAMKGSR
jgi:hypothetical protein